MSAEPIARASDKIADALTDFLLVHGGSHGAWCWERLLPALAARGHRGHALDLPGAGDDPTPRRSVTVSSCLDAVDRFVAARGLGELVLVGHSIAGILLPQIALRQAARVRKVVFLAALVLERGERAIDLVPAARRPAYHARAAASGDGTLSIPWREARRRFFGGLPEGEARGCFARLTPQPFAVYLEPAAVSARTLPMRRRYVVCRRDLTFPPPLARRWARKLGGEVVEIDAGHGVMLERPEELAALLVADGSGGRRGSG